MDGLSVDESMPPYRRVWAPYLSGRRRNSNPLVKLGFSATPAVSGLAPRVTGHEESFAGFLLFYLSFYPYKAVARYAPVLHTLGQNVDFPLC